MGMSLRYWAIPPSSDLFRRVHREKPFTALMGALFPYGGSIYEFFHELEEEEREEILEWVIEEHAKVLGSRNQAEQHIADFREALQSARSANPGIERRAASLEKTSQLIEERLLRELRRVRGEDVKDFVARLMNGDSTLGDDFGLPPECTVGVIAFPVVREGSAVLDGLDASNLFSSDGALEEQHLEDFRRWRTLYREAAAAGESLLTGFC
jgi:hypothetical protein